MSLTGWVLRRFSPLSFGERGEREAARYLRRHGYRVVASRHRHRYGEVDLIAVDGETVVFVEVKTRRRGDDAPAEAVDAQRQKRLTRAGLAFLKSHGLLEYASRFDVVEVIWPDERQRPTVRHIQDAFPAVGVGQMYS